MTGDQDEGQGIRADRLSVNDCTGLDDAAFRSFCESSRDGIVVVEIATKKQIYCNAAFARMFRFMPDEILKLKVTELHPPEALSSVERDFETLVRGELDLSIQPCLRRDGSTFFGQIRAWPLTVNGRPCAAGFFEDVSERRQREQFDQLTLRMQSALMEDCDKKAIIQSVVGDIRDSIGLEAVALRLHEGSDYPYYETKGFPDDFVEAERYLCSRDTDGCPLLDEMGNPVLECMCGNVIQGRYDPSLSFFSERGSFWTNSTTELLASTSEKDRQARTRNRCHGEGYESVALIPLPGAGGNIGLLQLNDTRRNRFTDEFIRQCEVLAAAIASGVKRLVALDHLRKERELSRRIIDDSPIAITQLDLDGRIVDANQRAIDLLGITKANMGSRNYNSPEWKIADLQGNLFPDDKLPFRRIMKTGEPVHGVEHAIGLPDGTRRLLSINGAPLHDAQGKIERIVFAIEDITLRQEHEAHLATIAWMLDKESGMPSEPRAPHYGDVTKLNTDRTIRDSVGLAILDAMGTDLMRLLDTSVAVYEKNGDYAYGSFVSKWCSVMDGASRRLCQTDDNWEALACGRWLCHENCWNDSARAAIESGKPTDIQCVGGIHLYAVPVFAGDEVVGAVNIGYGSPPNEEETLAKLADEFGEDVSTLRRAALAFRPRPHFVVEAAKARLHLVAQQIGQMVENHRIQEELRRSQATLQAAMDNSPAGIAIADAPSGKLRYVNDAGLLIRGGSREEVVNGVDQYVASWQLLDLDGTPLPTDEVPLARAITRGEAYSREFIIRRDKDDDRIVIARAAPIKGEAGNVVAAIVVFLDITERKKAELALIESEQRLYLATRAAGIGIWVWDIIQDTMIWDDRILELYGIRNGAPFIDLDFWRTSLHPEYREYAVNEVMAALRGERDCDIEFRVQWPDGTLRWLKADGLVIRNDAGEPIRMLGTNYDVTARKQAEEDLRLTVEAVSDGIWKWHFKTSKLDFNPKYYTMLGYEPDEFPATFESWRDLIHPDDLSEALAVAERYLVTRPDTYENTFRLRTKEGGYRWIRATARTVERDESGQAVRMIGNHEDITRQKNSAEQIRQLERRNRALLDYSPVCHKIIDLDFNLQYMNANGFKMLRMQQSEDLYGKPYPFDFFPEASRKQMNAELQRVKDAGEQTSFEGIACDVEGNEVWLHHTLIPVPSEQGDIDYITVVSADITEQKKMQDRLRHTEKMDAIGHLAGGVAHDFNNQLAGVLGYGNMLANRLDDPDLKRYAENICTAARRSSDLTKKLLAFSRKGQFQLTPVDVHKVIQEAVDMLQHSVDKRIRIRQHYQADEYTVMGDPSQIQNAFLNLSINARDAMPDGGLLTFITEMVNLDAAFGSARGYELKPGSYVRISVEDTGCGIPEDVRPHIFEPFYTTKEQGKGTGMGLAAVYGTIKQHKGCIEIYTEVGKGTCFKIFLPLASQTKERDSAESESPNRLDHLHILVVDDEELVRTLACDMLSGAGHSVLSAVDGQDAVNLYREKWREIDLVILDMVMPRMGGKDAFRAMKEINPDIKAILSSGYSLNEESQAILAEGVLGFVQKPFDFIQLSYAIEHAVSGRGTDPSNPA